LAKTSGIVTGLSGRYATALFDLARDAGSIDAVGKSLATVAATLDASDDFRALTTSPLVGREAALAAVLATADKLKLDATTKNFLGVLAKNRRLSALPLVVRDFNRLAAAHRGETTAEVTSAHPLSADQVAALKTTLGAKLGGDVAVDLRVDPAILGGLVVRVGSRMIDSSLRTKIDTLAVAMKG
jgi:F-type H+-transporting ATPase subunit delta